MQMVKGVWVPGREGGGSKNAKEMEEEDMDAVAKAEGGYKGRERV